MALQFIDSIDDSKIKDKKVLVRFDFNVPLDKETKEITDTTRIDNALETIKLILNKGASKLIMMSHLGRPKGQVNSDFSLEPVATYLADKLGEEVTLTESCLDRGIKTLLTLNSNKIILLENLRFHKEETENDREFARKLSEYADIYVNDAFGAAHRKHASTYEINAFFKNKAYAGLLMKKEIEALSKITQRPETPFVAVVGGAKVSDKIKIIERLLSSVSNLIIGGAMAYPFLKAKGNEVGTSLCSDEDVSLAKKIFSQSTAHKIILPIDHIVSSEFGGKPEAVDKVGIPDGKMGLDIGEQTIAKYSSILREAKTILWNGPMGIFENEDYAKGTFAIAEVLSESNAYTLVGGGDSVSAVNKSGLANKMSHVSTGGGASLEFIEKGSLPGISALKFGVE
ncbi:phosphoglycerate kinase [Halobacteriovorax sp. RT-1-4]|uniref:phosphoglycerate kinase n=1 Tax=unclassified Halobacteriovorax TaxID=2639665 RepID=UPI003999C23B